MRFTSSPLVWFGLLAPLASGLTALAAPATADAPYSVSKDKLAAAIHCPDGISAAKKGGIILAVHGTGSTGEESYGPGPYRTILPNLDDGYNFCYVDLPNRSLTDLQVSAEYVAHAIHHLAPKSATKQVKIVSHSQGGPDVQWALTFWPSTRGKVSHFAALSADFHATSYPLPRIPYALCESLYQQGFGSQFANLSYTPLLNKAHVNTFSIYSFEDEVVFPGGIVGKLDGAAVAPIQQVCPLLIPAEHFAMVITEPAFELVRQFFRTGSAAKALSNFDPARCLSFANGEIINFKSIVPYASAVLSDVLSIALTNKAPGEPLFKQYVCDKGLTSAKNCGEGHFSS